MDSQIIDLSSISLPAWEIILRLIGGLIIGGVIGTERELTHRPAGMRTHMLVSLGACAVAIMSQLIFAQYRVFGATPDPARLSAQVIAGVGFLGAGTIMREGANVKGLTTAASVWCVACLGLAMGGGYYVLAIAGTVLMLLVLTLFEHIQAVFIGHREVFYTIHITSGNVTETMNSIYSTAEKNNVTITNVTLKQADDRSDIDFKASVSDKKAEKKMRSMISELSGCDSVEKLTTEETDI